MDDRYEPKQIEPKWQAVWAGERAFNVDDPDPGAENPAAFYMLEMLPYPSGTLHMGHVLNYTLGDVVTHFRRRNGAHVLRPMGFDSFGLPAENAAIREGGHPREIVDRNIAAIERQMRGLGWAIDWDRVTAAHDPAFYRWTQWLFLRFLREGLAYRKQAPVKWCPNDQTVLAESQVIDGRCERCGAEVEAKSLEQWFLRITAYADALLEDHALLDWPDRTIAIQRNWIGRSEGAEILFRVDDLDLDLPVFTTRPDTLFGATFFVLAPEHPLVERLAAGTEQAGGVRDYVRRTSAATGTERLDPEREKSGVHTGRYATNPINGERIPIWVADYVLMEYGTGAIMAVPAHDERDYEFARRFDLPVRTVVVPAGGDADPGQGAFSAHTDGERLTNSGEFDGLPSADGATVIVERLADLGRGRPAVSFRLRDWLISRQRYWGCPIPVVHCERCGIVPVPDEELPVLLPDVEEYLPRGRSPLAAAEEWITVPCPSCGAPARREADTMDTFVDSSWYFLRYCDPHNDEAPFDRRLIDHWCPIDLYIGGIDHSTGHLLYSRFFVKVLNELGLLGFREPFTRLFHQGWVQFDGSKMSKSRGNVIGPDDLVEAYGADAVRLYILFVGPADQDMEWTESGIEGMARFVRRLWRAVLDAATCDPSVDADDGPLVRKAHETIGRVTDDIGRRFHFNTPIAAVMELVNELGRSPDDPGARFAAETAVSLIQPYAPHVAEELWERLGHARLWEQPWPVADERLLERETFELVIQVNGKVRDRVEVGVDLSRDELVAHAQASPRVQAHLDGREIRQAIVVPRKLVNLVV
ncbi:MAG: leucine--tRNA ligase [Gaiellaceae bacterium]